MVEASLTFRTIICADAESAILPGLLIIVVALSLTVWLIASLAVKKRFKALKVIAALIVCLLGVIGLVDVVGQREWPLDSSEIKVLVISMSMLAVGILTLKKTINYKSKE